MLSFLFGLIGVLSYALILKIVDLEIDQSNLFIVLMLPGIFLKIFVFCFALLFVLLSIYTIVREGYSNLLLTQVLIALTIVVLTSVTEYQKSRSSDLFDATSAENLITSDIQSLYLIASEQNDVTALSNLAGQKHISDSLELQLSNSINMEVRRAIGWYSDSKSILTKLSKDKDYEVRMAVATNHITPITIVDSLQNDPNEMVKNTAFAMYQARTK